MRARLIFVLFLAIAATDAAASEPLTGAKPSTVPSVTRTPQWPLKDRRTLFTDTEIAQARANVANYPSARDTAQTIIKAADKWAAWDDAKLVTLITSAAVPRAFDVGIAGCPRCGHDIDRGPKLSYTGGRPWIIDLERPFKVICPIDGSVYPTNDYAAYYASDFETKKNWDTSYVDDGWGWTDPKSGEKYWFVAYYNHYAWDGLMVPGVLDLARAYQLTGDRKYAHKALVMLQRIAEVYPAMDHERQSRYGTMMAATGRRYPGKVLNRISETFLARRLAEAYDAVWETVDGDRALQQSTGMSGEQVRAFIEANLLEEAIDAYFDGKIRGNFGMHQTALVYLAQVRQHGEQDKWFDDLMDGSSSTPALLGLRFALYNLLSRDGVPSESSPGYNFLWVQKIGEYGNLLERAGREVFASPKLRRMYDAVLDQVHVGRFTPAIGDSGTVWGTLVWPDALTFQTAYHHYRDPRYARFLAGFGAAGDGGFKTYESLFHEVIEAPSSPAPAVRARLLGGFGLGIINNPADTTSASLYYGQRHGHGHFDRLNVELFAGGQPIMPDLGYPDAMNDFVPGIFTWSKNTISHNTVTVDASRQVGDAPGTVELFVDGAFARVVDVSAPGTYPQCEQYRRALIQVDCGEEQSYFIDIFMVGGGKQHDYSLHGPPGAFEVIGGEWSGPHERGTLAGENVSVAEIYDDPVLGGDGYNGGYSAYRGSGFQHIYNVRRHQRGETMAQWSHEKDPAVKLRIRVLPQAEQQLMLGNARVSPVKYPQVLTYLIARRQGENLRSRFASVIEPVTGKPLIKDVRKLDLPGSAAMAMEVVRNDGGSDLIIYDATNAEKTAAAITTDAHVAVVRRDASGGITGRYVVGGSFLTVEGETLNAARRGGSVVRVDAAKGEIHVKPDESQATPQEFTGRVVHFANGTRRTSHTIVSAMRDGENVLLRTADDLLVGRARVERVEEGCVTTRTAMPLAPSYRGTTLASASFEPLARVGEVSGGRIRLETPIPSQLAPAGGQDVWLVNVGPGERFELPALLDVTTGRER